MNINLLSISDLYAALELSVNKVSNLEQDRIKLDPDAEKSGEQEIWESKVELISRTLNQQILSLTEEVIPTAKTV